MKLIQIGDYYVDPTRINSVWHPLGDKNRIMFNIDHGNWSQQFEVESDEECGWTIDGLAQTVNDYCSGRP